MLQEENFGTPSISSAIHCQSGMTLASCRQVLNIEDFGLPCLFAIKERSRSLAVLTTIA